MGGADRISEGVSNDNYEGSECHSGVEKGTHGDVPKLSKGYGCKGVMLQSNVLACMYLGLVIGRAKRAPQWGVQSRFRVIYIAYYMSKSGIWLVISRVASYFHEPKASANTAYK